MPSKLVTTWQQQYVRLARSMLAIILAITAGISVSLTSVWQWAEDTLQSENEVEQIAKELLASPTIREAVADAIVDPFLSDARIVEIVSELPGFLQDPAEEALVFAREQMTGAIEAVLVSAPAEAIWTTAVLSAREQLVDEQSDEVTLGLEEIASLAGNDVEDALGPVKDYVGLPDEFGQITVVQRDQLPELWQALLFVERQAVLWPTVALICGTLALLIGTRRWFIGFAIAVTTSGTALLLIPMIHSEQSQALDRIVGDVDRAATDAAFRIVFSGLVSQLTTLSLVALVVALACAGAGVAWIYVTSKRSGSIDKPSSSENKEGPNSPGSGESRPPSPATTSGSHNDWPQATLDR